MSRWLYVVARSQNDGCNQGDILGGLQKHMHVTIVDFLWTIGLKAWSCFLQITCKGRLHMPFQWISKTQALLLLLAQAKSVKEHGRCMLLTSGCWLQWSMSCWATTHVDCINKHNKLCRFCIYGKLEMQWAFNFTCRACIAVDIADTKHCNRLTLWLTHKSRTLSIAPRHEWENTSRNLHNMLLGMNANNGWWVGGKTLPLRPETIVEPAGQHIAGQHTHEKQSALFVWMSTGAPQIFMISIGLVLSLSWMLSQLKVTQNASIEWDKCYAQQAMMQDKQMGTAADANDATLT